MGGQASIFALLRLPHFLHPPHGYFPYRGHPAADSAKRSMRESAAFENNNMTEKFDWLKNVLRGTFVLKEHFDFVKGVLLRAFDEVDMDDKLTKLKTTNPGYFAEPCQRDDKAAIVNSVMRESGVTQAAYVMVKSYLRHGTSRESMLVTAGKLRASNPGWFKPRK